jgi:1,4-alpha-glucan branching enzyme
MVQRKQGLWVFTLIRPLAHRVYLVGDFNGWSQTIQMQRNPQGLWEATLALQPGMYRFRYHADGQWLTDYAAFGIERNHCGEYDSILFVPDERHRHTADRLRFPEADRVMEPVADSASQRPAASRPPPRTRHSAASGA